MKNTIKQLGICLVLSALSLLPVLSACSDSNDAPAAPEIVISENILTNGINFSKTGGTSTLSIKSNVSLEVISNQDWCTVTPAVSASATVFRYTVTVEENPDAVERTATVTVNGGGLTETVTVKQLAGELPDMGMESDAMTLAAKIKLGWNLGNSLEACNVTYANGFVWGTNSLSDMDPGETKWGNPATTQKMISAVKAAGFNAVRIPCAWYGYMENETDYTIKASWLNRVQEVVDYCYAENMYVILNIHYDGGWLEKNCKAVVQDNVNKVQKALWTQIATKFKDYDEHLLFAGCNEPNAANTAEMEVLKSYEQTFIDAVRATGGNNALRNLIVQGPNTDITNTSDYGQLPVDNVPNRLMVEIHYYTPWNFCGMTTDESWGKMAYFWGTEYHVDGSDRNYQPGGYASAEAEMEALFKKMQTEYVSQGIPVILGEFGANRRSSLTGDELTKHLASRAYYLKTVVSNAGKYGLVPFYWDNGYNGDNTMALFNRNTCKVYDQQALDALIEGIAN
ncbi:MAG: cellulase family glycosylhydrolase [Bacteroides sp.]|uniref:cellulase family glycosylhydrolase n=1 Tax=Bacteroides sp. TaxID=29523 RepID=UPI0025B9B193|nr:cellulase family glycosylhydrolase [Bacteroides sp.]MBS6238028.1 cellulase family glycosylhydrolase [Bacteroides sp.]